MGWLTREELLWDKAGRRRPHAKPVLYGDEIGGLLDSVNLRMFNDSDPYPPEIDFVPSMRDEDEARREPEEERREATA